MALLAFDRFVGGERVSGSDSSPLMLTTVSLFLEGDCFWYFVVLESTHRLAAVVAEG